MARKRIRITPAMRRKRRGLTTPKNAEAAYRLAWVRVVAGIVKAYSKDAEATIRARADGVRWHTDALRSAASLAPVATKEIKRAFDVLSGSVDASTSKGLQSFGIDTLGSDKRLSKIVASRRAENVDLIKNVTATVRDQMAEVLANAGPGTRWEDIAPRISERGAVSISRAELIARDQSLSTAADIVETRQRAAGISAFAWSGSLDERERDEHTDLEGLVFDWDDPPDEGKPGEPVNCRCVAIPVIDE